MAQTSASKSPAVENYVLSPTSSLYESDFLKYLSSAYNVLRIIFSYLYMDDLENAAKAFESWKAVAEIIKSERNVIESFFLDNKHDKPKIWNEAAFCVRFSSMPCNNFEDIFTKYVNPSADFLSCVSVAGIIGTTNDLSQLIQRNFSNRKSCMFPQYCSATLRIPKMDKVGIKTLTVEEDMNLDLLKIKIHSCIPSNAIIKCLLILTVANYNESTYPEKKRFIEFLKSRQEEPFAIGGCKIDHFQNKPVEFEDRLSTTYVIFFGDNVDAASTVLSSRLVSHSGINRKIQKLREKCPDTKRGILFVFRCIGRRQIIYKSRGISDFSKWEGNALRKYFPNTAVIGCFGYGEYGVEHPYDQYSKKKAKITKTYELSYSTSIVYVGFKK